MKNNEMNLEIIRFQRYMLNWEAIIVLNGKTYAALRQGGLGIWAFTDRSKLSRAQQDLLDAQIDDSLKQFK